MTPPLSEEVIKRELLQLWSRNPEKFAGYRFLHASKSTNVNYLCEKGHPVKTSLSNMRRGDGCGNNECYGFSRWDHQHIKEKVLEAWSTSVKFLGYKFIRCYFENGYWRYVYECAADHERVAIFQAYDGKRIHSCSHLSHPYHNKMAEPKIRRRILAKWAEDPRIWSGYSIVEIGTYTYHNTKIRCNEGHISNVSAYRIVRYNMGCCHRDCMTYRTFQNGTNYKYMTKYYKVSRSFRV